MTYETAWIYYKTSRAIAKAAGVHENTVSKWKATGLIPPEYAVILENESAGGVKIIASVYAKPSGNA